MVTLCCNHLFSLMKKHELIFSLLKVPLDFLVVFGSFYLARNLREINDFIPWVQLPTQIITNEYLLAFALMWSALYVFIFSIHWLYNIKLSHSKIKENLDIIWYSFYWLLFFSIIVYFGQEMIYQVKIPRLVIIFTFFIEAFGVIIVRSLLNYVQISLLERGIIPKRKLLLITNKNEHKIHDILQDIENANIYNIVGYINPVEINLKQIPYLGGAENVERVLENYQIDEIIYIHSDFSQKELFDLWDYSRILWIRYRYIANTFDVTKSNTTFSLLNKVPMIEIKTTPLDAWGRIGKRMMDLLGSIIGLILLSPIFVIIAILIKLEDPEGPVIYKNTRVGQNGTIFYLYKFRYIYWKYCIKDSYWVQSQDDEALAYEKKLIEEKSIRHGPLYKIANDPRKTKIGTFIEKYSLDELPQLLNVFLGTMSLVGPRPHQPREVEKYLTAQRRVLTIKPGMSGLAQVNGREKNNFEDEVNLDIHYIENWNFLLDFKIIAKTFAIILQRK